MYRILDYAFIYRLAQFLLAPGQQFLMRKKLKQLAQETFGATFVLDIGCGPASWLWRVGLHPVGLDLSASYIRQFRVSGCSGVVGSADCLPFKSHLFDSVWTIGLLHHLDDGAVLNTIGEMIRVCRQGGRGIIVDAVMPRSAFWRPIAYAVRRLDRGRFIRSEKDFGLLLKQAIPGLPKGERFTFSFTGLEAVAYSTPS